MTHVLHTIHYQDLFNGNELSHPLELSFPKNNHVIVISDCHLTERFDEEVFGKFEKIIQKADVLIINGDFWADSSGSFEQFVTSKWRKLFPLLKAKNTYYVFGNHDMPHLSDKRIHEFCSWAGFRMKVKAGELSLHIEHGHLISGKLVKTILIAFQNHPKLLKLVTLPVGWLEEITRYYAKKTNSEILKKLNIEFKSSRHEVSHKHEYFLMGHTHVPEIDEENKYVNSGLTHNGHFNFIEVYQNKITISSL